MLIFRCIIISIYFFDLFNTDICAQQKNNTTLKKNINFQQFIEKTLSSDLTYQQIYLGYRLSKKKWSLQQWSFYSPSVSLGWSSTYQKTIGQHRYGTGFIEPEDDDDEELNLIDFSRNDEKLTRPDPENAKEELRHSISLKLDTLKLFNNFNDRISLNMNEIQFENNEIDFKQKLLAYFKEITLFYYQYYYNQENLELIDATIKLLNSLKSESSQAQVSKLLIELNSNKLSQRYHAEKIKFLGFRERFTRLTSLAYQRYKINELPELRLLKSKELDILANANSLLEIKQASNNLELTKYERRLLWMSNLPELTIQLSGTTWGRGYQKLRGASSGSYYPIRQYGNRENVDLSIGLSLTIPLGGNESGPMNYLEFKEMEVSMLESTQDLRIATINAQSESELVKAKVANLETELKTYHNLVRQQQQLLSESVDAYLKKKTDLVSCLQAIIKSLEAKQKQQGLTVENLQYRFEVAQLTGDAELLRVLLPKEVVNRYQQILEE